ncbi:MAG: ribosome biogenesis GTPase Der [Thermodesulfovibrionales bacterium]|nr:ribosome biogenesis GTPase Der [Thermodesulfovibrionales bacterium]
MGNIVAIVGQPNAGKTTLFNRLLKRSQRKDVLLAITDKTPGVTRDRNYGQAIIDGKEVVFVDTGGFLSETLDDDNAKINEQVKEQAMLAIDEAHLVIHLLDSKSGLTPTDIELSKIFRRLSKPFLTVANKVDSKEGEKNILEFYALGVDEIIPISALSGYNIDYLEEKICQIVTPSEPKSTLDLPKIAIVGRPNTGKSTLINNLLGKNRLIVDSSPGTTRDPIDTIVRFYNRPYLLIDTAGIRRKTKASQIERYAIMRAIKSIQRSDIVVFLLDAISGVVDYDQKIGGIISDFQKPLILLVNKWDLVDNPEEYFKRYNEIIREKLWFLDYAPILTASALTKKRITNIFSLIDNVLEQSKLRIATAELNTLIRQNKAILQQVEDTASGLKVLYMTQVSVSPPHFVIFINKKKPIKKQYIRFFERMIRQRYGFVGCPIVITVKTKGEN